MDCMPKATARGKGCGGNKRATWGSPRKLFYNLILLGGMAPGAFSDKKWDSFRRWKLLFNDNNNYIGDEGRVGLITDSRVFSMLRLGLLFHSGVTALSSLLQLCLLPTSRSFGIYLVFWKGQVTFRNASDPKTRAHLLAVSACELGAWLNALLISSLDL